MSELLDNAWIITRALILIAHALCVFVLAIGSMSFPGAAPGRAKLWAVPLLALAILTAAALPNTARFAFRPLTSDTSGHGPCKD